MSDPVPASPGDSGATGRDAFLGGRVTIEQPLNGYRAGIDPVLLAASVPARAGQSVLELGCGAGTALLCLGRRIEGLELTGVELQPVYAELARRNAAANALAARIETADLAALPAAIRAERYDHVMFNPPYFDRGSGTRAEDPGREIALGESTPLADWVAVAARRLAPRGRLGVIHRAEQLPGLLAACHGRVGSITIRSLHPREGRPARLVLMSAIKGGRAALRIAAPLILHAGTHHGADGEDYTPAIRAVLRDAAELPSN
ncbi:tRNA1(Val) (adenine(37)-N6)-methyltransferase [Profundibacterium mesophilum]|uniref:Trans-aconitate 2-methyltransferase n=1 Tax=Profundibacterium mesophilum KAUST100406-0324 TaxID=1037889 RepID=A0A921NVX2_9RHOB|nr:methyltransferase [Profundibacterium mesophilum]KAF0676465.1 trans-aconitate 2-methyltransferase [Profundibacterium mesophilum KAUST100406-0324]